MGHRLRPPGLEPRCRPLPLAVPDLPPGSSWSKGILAVLLLFASILAHELGHALVARREGVQTRRIVLFAFGGVAELKAEPPGPGAEFRIAAAGPVVSLGLVVLFGVLTGALAGRPVRLPWPPTSRC